uniref:ShKT domain-containing protein n=1 Tax=Trieres chinensis TaxID=1514140 RepID=A0A7S1Z6W0_TRICV|mmetsp:Transcript_18671/g.37854  ORF Transcript_18671/g.37854 Transcript_18671/m.37854 type:complete len:242 (+) Transcript_18671:290-1015(+)
MKRAFSLAALATLVALATSKSVDKLPDCEEMANAGHCKNKETMEFMMKNCPASCEKLPGVAKVEVKPISDDEPQFFDLSATDAKGNTIDFEEFEGYVTVIVNAARKCGHTEEWYRGLDHLVEIWPYTLEIMAFPFRSKVIDEDPDSCPSHKASDLSKKRKFHVMKEVEVNGPNTHPVYKFFKNKFEMDEINEHYATFFLVNPDGTVVEAHHGQSFVNLKNYISRHMSSDLAGQAKLDIKEF